MELSVLTQFQRIGATNSFMAELSGLRDGLILCCNLHLPSLIVELDAKAIVDALLNLNYENKVISPILDDCRQLVTQFHRIQFKHCYAKLTGVWMCLLGGVLSKTLIFFLFLVRLRTF